MRRTTQCFYLCSMTKPKYELNDKALQALELYKTRTLTNKQIAEKVGWSEDHIVKMIAGDTATCGSSALLFSEQVKEIDREQAAHIKKLTKTTREAILAKFEEFALSYKSKKTNREARKEMVSIMNAIGKITPNVEIGSFSYTQGLSAEDLVNEFRRLKGMGSDGRGVLPAFQRESGEIPGIEAPGGST